MMKVQPDVEAERLASCSPGWIAADTEAGTVCPPRRYSATEKLMNAPTKPDKKPAKHPPRPTGKAADPDELHERTMRRFPKIMARLAE